MAVVKANYVKRGDGDRSRAKASIRYIQHRRGKDGHTITRQLFGSDGPMDRHVSGDRAREGSASMELKGGEDRRSGVARP